jgi:glycosyltransferase involved in cell wall biosynthesis
VEAPAIASLIEGGTDVLNPHEWLAHRAAALFGIKGDVPIIWSYNDPSGWHVSHNGNREPLPKHLFGWFDSRLVNRFAALTVLDRRMQAIAAASFRTPAYIVRSGVDAGLFVKEATYSGGRANPPRGVRLLSVGILFPHRRFEDAIRAVHLARGDRVDCSYEIIGSDRFCPAYGASLRTLVRDLDLAGTVTLRFESVSEEVLAQAYMNADGLIFPNQRQTWGLAVLEAMARGLPVIVSRGAGVHEVLSDAENALLVDPERHDQIAAAIHRFAEEPDFRWRLGAAGRQLVQEKYTSRHYAEQMLRLFRSHVDAA